MGLELAAQTDRLCALSREGAADPATVGRLLDAARAGGPAQRAAAGILTRALSDPFAAPAILQGRTDRLFDGSSERSDLSAFSATLWRT